MLEQCLYGLETPFSTKCSKETTHSQDPPAQDTGWPKKRWTSAMITKRFESVTVYVMKISFWCRFSFNLQKKLSPPDWEKLHWNFRLLFILNPWWASEKHYPQLDCFQVEKYRKQKWITGKLLELSLPQVPYLRNTQFLFQCQEESEWANWSSTFG